MKTKIVGIFVCMLLIANILPISANMVTDKETDNMNKSSSMGGWYEEIDGVKILHVNGSYYEMGYQHGYLLSDMVWENFRGAMNTYKQIMSYEDMLSLYEGLEEYIPQEIKDEMQGLADGSGLSFDNVSVISILDFLGHDTTACVTGAAWDTATIDGELYHFRSFDWSLNIQDPETGTYMHDNYILFVRNPDSGYASIYPNYAGTIGNYGGVNEDGITIGSTVSWCMDDISDVGIPHSIRIKWALDTSSNIEDAIDIINSNKTRGWNFIISDSEEKIAVIIEQSATHSFIGYWDDPEESNTPFYSIENVVRRGNFYVDRAMAELQRVRYKSTRFFVWLIQPIKIKLGIYDPYKYEYYKQIKHYQLLSKELTNNWGNLDLNLSMELLRSVYRGDNDIIFKILKIIMPHRAYTNDNYQWVVCPVRNELVISFAQGETSAHENEVHYFKLDELWNATQP